MALLRINLHQILIFKSLQPDGVTMSDQESFSYKIHIIIVVSLKNDLRISTAETMEKIVRITNTYNARKTKISFEFSIR